MNIHFGVHHARTQELMAAQNQLSSHEHCCKTLQQPYPHQMYLFIALSTLWGNYGETVGYLRGVYAVFMGSYYV